MRSLIIALAAIALASPAMAQETNAGADASNTVNVVAVTGAQGTSRVWTTPNVAPGYVSGANPCLVGTGGGAAGGPIGFSLNLGKSDKGCTRRSDAAAWNAMGFTGAAIARMCQDQGNADAFFASTGLACPGTDRERYKLADGSKADYAVIPNRTVAAKP